MDPLLIIAVVEALIVGAITLRCVNERRRSARIPVTVRLMTRR